MAKKEDKLIREFELKKRKLQQKQQRLNEVNAELKLLEKQAKELGIGSLDNVFGEIEAKEKEHKKIKRQLSGVFDRLDELFEKYGDGDEEEDD